MEKMVDSMKSSLVSQGEEINKYRETHNLKIKGEESKEPEKKDKDASKAGGVLVAKNS